MMNADRGERRLNIRIGVVDHSGIKKHKIGIQSFSNQAAIPKPKPACRFRSDVPDGLFQRHNLFIAELMTQEAGERGISPGMRVGAYDTIGADAVDVVLHDINDILFRNGEVNGDDLRSLML